jgi:hypothetical protein
MHKGEHTSIVMFASDLLCLRNYFPVSNRSFEIRDFAFRTGKCTVIKTSTRQTIFLPVVGLVDAAKLTPGDLVGVNKDSYLILDTLPAEYDSRVKAMEVDEKPTEEYSDIGGLDKQIQEVISLLKGKGVRLHDSFKCLVVCSDALVFESRINAMYESMASWKHLINFRRAKSCFLVPHLQLVEALVLPLTHGDRFEAIGIRPPKVCVCIRSHHKRTTDTLGKYENFFILHDHTTYAVTSPEYVFLLSECYGRHVCRECCYTGRQEQERRSWRARARHKRRFVHHLSLFSVSSPDCVQQSSCCSVCTLQVSCKEFFTILQRTVTGTTRLLALLQNVLVC